MDAEALLSPSDAAKFDSIVLGGILGNFPSEDRTAEVRVFEFPQRRHLGPDQMSTNTAALAAYYILEKGIPLCEMKFVDSPEIETGPKDSTTLPFRFFDEGWVRDAKPSGVPLFPDGMLQLLRDQLDDPILDI
eukprot:GHVU01017706.1.p3 GENE.GHVU01017706.1~~GHVU01017706.1.p3  ORF type:complete len:133 (-),score=33.13 GHVU01017706.1:496-894(-)